MCSDSTVGRKLKIGDAVRHYKGNVYKVIDIAEHVDNGKIVLYREFYGERQLWARDYEEFMGKVGENTYRFNILTED